MLTVSEAYSELIKQLRWRSKKLRLRRMTEFWICLWIWTSVVFIYKPVNGNHGEWRCSRIFIFNFGQIPLINSLFSLLTLNTCSCICHLEKKLQLAFSLLFYGKMNSFLDSPCNLSASSILKSIEINGNIDTNLVNPFLANVPILYTLKITGKQRNFWCFQEI